MNEHRTFNLGNERLLTPSTAGVGDVAERGADAAFRLAKIALVFAGVCLFILGLATDKLIWHASGVPLWGRG